MSQCLQPGMHQIELVSDIITCQLGGARLSFWYYYSGPRSRLDVCTRWPPGERATNERRASGGDARLQARRIRCVATAMSRRRPQRAARNGHSPSSSCRPSRSRWKSCCARTSSRPTTSSPLTISSTRRFFAVSEMRRAQAERFDRRKHASLWLEFGRRRRNRRGSAAQRAAARLARPPAAKRRRDPRLGARDFRRGRLCRHRRLARDAAAAIAVFRAQRV